MANVYMDLDNRTFYLQDSVNEESMASLVFNMMSLIEDDKTLASQLKEFEPQPIHLYINSCGGKLDDMWTLVDLIERSETPIYTYCTSYAFSAAFVIFVAGHRRFIGRHAQVMYHQLSAGTQDTYQSMNECLDYFAHCQDDMEQFVFDNTEIPEERLIEVREKKIDWYMTALEAIEYGVADEVLGCKLVYKDQEGNVVDEDGNKVDLEESEHVEMINDELKIDMED